MIQSVEDIQTLVKRGFSDWKQHGDVNVIANADLLIFNYTQAAQFTASWNPFELVSRGLILNARSGEIVARPFDKFFNWLEGGRKSSGHIVTVTEKVDGSLGILYRTPEGYRIATRGSFTGKQALWATQFLHDHFDLIGLPPELTLLFAIVYPENRIVVNYHEREDLVLLAARNRFTGAYLPFFPDVYSLGDRYGFTLPRVFPFNNLTEIITSTDTLSVEEEGYVVEFSDSSRFKFKGDRYLELQKLLTSLTFKHVLEAMQNQTISQILGTVPDEFLGEVRGWIDQIQTTFERTVAAVTAAFTQAPKDSRKAFALWVQTNQADLAPFLFTMLDQRDIRPLIFKLIAAQVAEQADDDPT